MTVFGRSCLHLIVVFAIFGLIQTSTLDIKDGGFENFVVAINKDVPYTPEIVGKLQLLLEDVSEKLHDATGLYLRGVSILVPSSWQRERTWEKTDKLTFGGADLRVDKPHPYYKNLPYTHPTFQCGEMQNYIHITPDFVKDNQSKEKGTLLTNQFASYRWGVFEDVVKPNSDGGSMSVTQEKVCGLRSAWDVIRKHGDYQQSGGTRTRLVFSVVYNENDRTTETEGKECGRPVVMLLDFSYSMYGTESNVPNYRFLRQMQAGTKFINEILPFSTHLGIIAFSSTNKPLISPLTKITSTEDKDRMASTLNVENPGSVGIGQRTGIGGALQSALKMLRNSHFPTNESRIVLVTDGEENEKPLIPDVLPEILESKVKVHSVAVGEDAEVTLGELCKQTGGQLGKYVEVKAATLTQVIADLWGDFNMLCVEDKPIQIENRAILLDRNNPEKEESVSIDSSIQDAEITFTPEQDNIKVTITAPDLKTYDDKSSEYRQNHLTHVIKFTIENMEPGEWKTKIIRKSVTPSSNLPEQVIMNVKAKAKEEAQTYEVRSWLNSVIVEIPAVTRIYAEVTRGYAPLIKAKVTASIEVPEEGTVTLELKDDGIWPDVRALDGIYTVEFQRSGTGDAGKRSTSGSPASERYSVDITVTPVEGETKVVQKLVREDGQSETDVFDFQVEEADIEGTSAESFKRKDSPGAFEIKNLKYGTDQYPPARVVDLSLIRAEGSEVTLEWTAPGDDLNKGRAKEYEFRMWYNETEMRIDLNSCILIKADKIVEGCLSPSQSGSKEVMKFRLPDYWPSPYVYIAMVTRDDAALQSEVSNIVKVKHTTPGTGYSPVDLLVSFYAIIYFITRLIETRC